MSAELLSNLNPAQFGIVGFALILVWKLLDVAKQLFLAHKVPASASLPCQLDPSYPQKVTDIHKFTDQLRSHVDHGDLGCQWKDREEVRDYIDVSKQQVTALQSVVDELRLLRQELVMTRNGKS